MATRQLTREELYRRIWAQPAEDVARDLGISGVALGKRCAALDVPKPPRGHWQRVKAGHTAPRPPLPATPVPKPRPAKATAAYVGPAPPERYRRDPLVQATATVLRRASTDRYGLLIRPRGAQICDLRVSTATLERALYLMTLLLVAAPERGCAVTVAPKMTRLVTPQRSWRLYLKERVDAVPPPSTPPRRELCETATHPLARPSGTLMVVIETEGGYGRRGRVSDGRRPLEERIGEVFGLLPRLEQAEAALERKRAETQRRWRLEAERRERQARRAVEARACQQLLLEQAAAWARQAELRAYLQAVAQAGALPPAQMQVWLAWAQEAGAALDPLRNGALRDLARRVERLQAGDLTHEEDEDS